MGVFGRGVQSRLKKEEGLSAYVGDSFAVIGWSVGV